MIIKNQDIKMIRAELKKVGAKCKLIRSSLFDYLEFYNKDGVAVGDCMSTDFRNKNKDLINIIIKSGGVKHA
jgi:hypothetical protein